VGVAAEASEARSHRGEERRKQKRKPSCNLEFTEFLLNPGCPPEIKPSGVDENIPQKLNIRGIAIEDKSFNAEAQSIGDDAENYPYVSQRISAISAPLRFE